MEIPDPGSLLRYWIEGRKSVVLFCLTVVCALKQFCLSFYISFVQFFFFLHATNQTPPFDPWGQITISCNGMHQDVIQSLPQTPREPLVHRRASQQSFPVGSPKTVT